MAEKLQQYQLRINGPGIDPTEGYVVVLPHRTISIGRHPEREILLRDPENRVSRLHAWIDYEAGHYRLTDPGSQNGTFLNGHELPRNQATVLAADDVITIEDYTLRVEAIAPPEPPEPPKPPDPPSSPPAPPGDDGLPPPLAPRSRPYQGQVPPGLHRYSTRLLTFLPENYQSSGGLGRGGQHIGVGAPPDQVSFLSRFLALFESVLLPIEWTVDGFDLLLDADSAPREFLDWLCSWFGLTFDHSWSEPQRRAILGRAAELYAHRGTKWALEEILEIYTGHRPEIDDTGDNLPPFTFVVRLPQKLLAIDETLLCALIDTHKPAHTLYTLEFT